MNLYSLLHKYSPGYYLLLPMLGRRAEEYPKFRDCFVSDDNKRIAVYLRVGGHYRNIGYGEEKLYEDPNFVTTYDDEFETDHAYYEFNPPDKWRADFDRILAGRYHEVSDEYVQVVKEFYPKYAAHGTIDLIFRGPESLYNM